MTHNMTKKTESYLKEKQETGPQKRHDGLKEFKNDWNETKRPY